MAYNMGFWGDKFHSIFTSLQHARVDISKFSISEIPNDNMLELVRIIFILLMNDRVSTPLDNTALIRTLFAHGSKAYEATEREHILRLSLFQTFSMFDLVLKRSSQGTIEQLVNLYSNNDSRRSGMSARLATVSNDEKNNIGLAIMLYYCFLVEHFFAAAFVPANPTRPANLIPALQMLEQWIEGIKAVPASLGLMDIKLQMECQVHASLTRELIKYVIANCCRDVAVINLSLGSFKAQFRPILDRLHHSGKDKENRYTLLTRFLADLPEEDEVIVDKNTLRVIVVQFHELILNVHAEKIKAQAWYGGSKPMTTTTRNLCNIHTKFFPSVTLPQLKLASRQDGFFNASRTPATSAPTSAAASPARPQARGAASEPPTPARGAAAPPEYDSET